MDQLEQYNKALVALVGTFVTVLSPHVGAKPWFSIVTGVITVLSVYHFRNANVEAVVQDAEQVVADIPITVPPPVVDTPETTPETPTQ